jgi:hypothetical protein
MSSDAELYTWEDAVERAIRYYALVHLKCKVFRDSQGRWRSIVIKE